MARLIATRPSSTRAGFRSSDFPVRSVGPGMAPGVPGGYAYTTQTDPDIQRFLGSPAFTKTQDPTAFLDTMKSISGSIGPNIQSIIDAMRKEGAFAAGETERRLKGTGRQLGVNAFARAGNLGRITAADALARKLAESKLSMAGKEAEMAATGAAGNFAEQIRGNRMNEAMNLARFREGKLSSMRADAARKNAEMLAASDRTAAAAAGKDKMRLQKDLLNQLRLKEMQGAPRFSSMLKSQGRYTPQFRTFTNRNYSLDPNATTQPGLVRGRYVA